MPTLIEQAQELSERAYQQKIDTEVQRQTEEIADIIIIAARTGEKKTYWPQSTQYIGSNHESSRVKHDACYKVLNNLEAQGFLIDTCHKNNKGIQIRW